MAKVKASGVQPLVRAQRTVRHFSHSIYSTYCNLQNKYRNYTCDAHQQAAHTAKASADDIQSRRFTCRITFPAFRYFVYKLREEEHANSRQQHKNTAQNNHITVPPSNSSFANCLYFYYSGFGTQLPERNCKIFHGCWRTKKPIWEDTVEPSQRRNCVILNRVPGVWHRQGWLDPLRDWEAVWLGKAH